MTWENQFRLGIFMPRVPRRNGRVPVHNAFYEVIAVAQKASRPAKKKGTSKAKPRAAKKPGRPASNASDRGKSPLYVLIIMALLAALALMINRFYEKPAEDKARSASDARREASKKKPAQSTAEKTADARDKKSREDARVRSDKTAATATKESPAREDIRVYFIRIDEKTDKSYITAANRTVDKRSVFENTMRELIKGPSAAEKKKGLLTAVPPELRLIGVKIKNKTAELDFNGTIEKGAGGSILINRIDQIVYTATQFPSVTSVVIKINGKKRETLGSDGLSIGGPLHRRRQ